MNEAVRGQGFGDIGPVFASGKIRDLSARLGDDQGPRRHIPRLELQLPESIKTAAGHVAEVQRGGPASPDGLGQKEESAPVANVVCRARPDVIRKAGGQKALPKIADLRDPDLPAVQSGAPVFSGREQLLPHRVVDKPQDGPAAVLQRRRDTKDRERVGEVRRPVEGVQDPAIFGAPRPSQVLLGQDAVPGKSL